MELILVIETDPKMRENIGEILEIAGYRVEYAEDGLEGLQKIFSILPDLVICDINLPGLSASGILDSIGNSPETGKIPFIVLTPNQSRDGQALEQYEGQGCLSIPFDYFQLIDAVEEQLKSNQSALTKISS